ncbi:hypothetical protein CryarDRAFT_1590 [Cryptosporangium arvum DSM 44712]|uniref:Uncharacterized protein n=1 Tax=Cryptosporangium arvum DSM 44712 TaxID=927661 RepID=A0A010YJT7_9ACTN|nr:hypothetical protein CryarDRAFT_1590 [Cryptosporangium arvum DSM 44712]
MRRRPSTRPQRPADPHALADRTREGGPALLRAVHASDDHEPIADRGVASPPAASPPTYKEINIC